MSRIKILMMVVSGLFMMIGILTMISAGAEAAPLNEDSVPVFYENIIQVENPDSLSVLVNKIGYICRRNKVKLWALHHFFVL